MMKIHTLLICALLVLTGMAAFLQPEKSPYEIGYWSSATQTGVCEVIDKRTGATALCSLFTPEELQGAQYDYYSEKSFRAYAASFKK